MTHLAFVRGDPDDPAPEPRNRNASNGRIDADPVRYRNALRLGAPPFDEGPLARAPGLHQLGVVAGDGTEPSARGSSVRPSGV
jgi:hypothetical protein